MRRISLGAAFVAGGLAAAGGASAHAFLRAANPPVGGAVAVAPAEVAIDYSEGVEPRFSAIEVRDASGNRVDTGEAHTAPGNNHRLVAGLKPVGPGAYTGTWRVTSTDTHKTEGSYAFTVGR